MARFDLDPALVATAAETIASSPGLVRVSLTVGNDQLREAAINELAASVVESIVNPPVAHSPALRTMATRLAPLDRRGFALRTDSNLAQFAAIRAGFGIGICQVAVASRDPMLVRILPEITLPLPIWIVMHEDLKTSARYRVVFDALAVGLSRLD